MTTKLVVPGLLLAVACLCGAPTTARTQVTLGVGGGPNFPVSDLDIVDRTGFNVLATLGFGIPAFPLGVRVDGMFNELPSRLTGVSHSQIWTVNANLVANLMNVPHALLVPYLIAGVGYYNNSYQVSTSGSTVVASGNTHNNVFGLNGGIGVHLGLGSASLFAEGRYHYIFTSGTHIKMIPLTIGINFGA